DLVHPFGGQAAAQVGGMSRLPAGSLAGALLEDGLGGARGVRRRRGAGVGGVGAQARFEFGDAAFQRRNPLVAFQTPGTSYRRHDVIIGTRQAGSCAPEPGERLRFLQGPATGLLQPKKAPEETEETEKTTKHSPLFAPVHHMQSRA